MRITAVEKNKRKRERISIFVDGEYSFYVMEEDFLRLHLYEEREISAEEIEDIRKSVNVRSARERAVRYLSSRLRSGEEVRTRLLEDGYDEDTAASVIEELKSIGYVNDRMYAEKFIYDRSKLKPESRKMLRYELLSRGVPEEIVEEALQGYKAEDRSIVHALIKRRFGKYDLSDEKIRKRVYSYLQHRGFSYELIHDVLKEMM